MIRFYRDAIESAREDQRVRRALAWECVALQHQLAVLRRSGTRCPRFRPIDRLFWVFMSWWWPAWCNALKIIQPATVLRWRRHGIALIWKYRSGGRWRGGRPRIAPETRQLIREMARANFLWGAPRIHGELLKLGLNVSQATVSRYMPRRDYPPTQTWRTFLRNQAFGIGTIGLGEAGRLSDELLALVRASIKRVVRCFTKVRDGIPSRLMEPSSTLHRLRPYRPSNRTDRRAVHGRCMPVRRWPTTLSVWTVADRRLSPYRSRASPRRKLPAFSPLHTIAIARTRQANHQFLQDDCTARLPRTSRSRTNDPLCPSATWRLFCESAIPDKVMRNDRGAIRIVSTTTAGLFWTKWRRLRRRTLSRLFISHLSHNDDWAIALKDWLVREGWSGPGDIFLDLDPDRGIAAGQRWVRALEDAATRCEAVLFLVSEDWLASKWCGGEYQLANGLNKKLFALLVDHMPIRLSVARICKVSVAFAFGCRFEKRGNGFPKPLSGARLCFA
jgi:hypothetical protein